MDITLPFTPRPYQEPLFRYMMNGGDRAFLLWHRRAGKDLTAWNWMILAALQRVGTYYHVFPSYTQGKKVIWLGKDRDGTRFLDYIPKQLIKGKPHETEMRVDLRNGSVLQVVGTDNIDSLMGTNIVGTVMSEYAIQDPRGWLFLSPILAENQGWSIFTTTPRGKNHAYELWNNVTQLERWFTSKQTVDDTGAVPQSVIDGERATGVPEEIIQQEYYCSFAVGNVGSYFGMQIEKLEQAGHMVPRIYDPRLPVHTAWDIGMNDATAIWFIQMHGTSIRLIDYFESNNQGLPYYVRVLQDKPYTYGVHLAPHDIAVRDWGTGISRIETAADLGLYFEPVTRRKKDEQVHAAHILLPRCVFDSEHAGRGIEALREYHREYDEVAKVYKDQPVKNWARHGADAFMILATGVDYLDNGLALSTAFDTDHEESYSDYGVRL